ncbi:MAG: cytochrome P450 [Sphingomonas sp.]
MDDSLLADDPRYAAMFDVAKDAEESGGRVEGDLTPRMNALREAAPVHHGSLRSLLDIPELHQAFNRPRDHYTLFTFKHCERAFRENLIFSSDVYRESPGVQNLGRTILEMTGDEHRRYRAVVQPMFVRPRAMDWWKPRWIDEAVTALVDRFRDWETVDLNMELCARLPVHVVTRGIGMRGEDALTFRDHLHRSSAGSRGLPEEERRHAVAEVSRMLKALIVERRRTPGDDVISGLAHNDFKLADGTTRKLTDEEVFGYCRLIMLAGGGTTWRQLGITIVALLRDYPLWEAVRADRSLIERAIEESARWMPTDPTFPRLMTEDVTLDGVTIPRGARVDLCLGAANRDPARWADPDRYDPRRKPLYHLGFGLGPHQCLGMNVAKQEMVSALNLLLDRFPDMRLDEAAAAPILHGGLEQRGMSSVPVRLR